MLTLRTVVYLPNVFATAHGIEFGTAVEVVLLSFALADRIKLLKREDIVGAQLSAQASRIPARG